MEKKLWCVYYEAPGSYDGIECEIVEGYDEDDALETFAMIYDYIVVSVEEDSREEN